MATLYITEQGATLAKIDDRIVIRKGRKVLEEIPAIKLDQIVIFGNANFTTPAIKFILEKGIDVAYLSSRGIYRGRLQPELAKDARLRRRQYEKSLDLGFRLALSKQLVSGKLRNMLALCRRHQRSRKQKQKQKQRQKQKDKDKELGAQLRTLERLARKVASAEGLEELRGYEGAASAAYYRAFRGLLRQDLGFERRNHRPPRDPVNALLSLGYTLLYNNVCGLINIVGLDPYQGFFHEPKRGHAALASDLMEEWRPVIVDPLVLSMINRGELSKGDFRWIRGQVRLTREGLERFLRRYDSRLAARVFYPRLKMKTSYYRCLEFQVRHLADLLLDREKSYQPFHLR